MKAFELTGKVDEKGQLLLDEPWHLNTPTQVKVIILVADENQEQNEHQEKAAEIHANLKLRGLPIQTEDILIAATAIVKGFIMVYNDSYLLRVEGLNIENWLDD